MEDARAPSGTGERSEANIYTAADNMNLLHSYIEQKRGHTKGILPTISE
ncbi:hypothetical protein JOD43_003131 [Pullulanibacillus pueri]|nr:hypothetical protein [Pullulanibacillus pueri]MBM7682952.1 hypothetical protein [Pullulanibacillus pueri]